jgi:hypothetical protein
MSFELLSFLPCFDPASVSLDSVLGLADASRERASSEVSVSREQQYRIGRTQLVILHRALLGGLVACMLLFAVLFYTGIAPFSRDLASGPVVVWTLATAPLIPLVLGWLLMRTKVPGRPSSLPAERYWAERNAGRNVLVAWVLWEGAALLGFVGVLISGAIAPAIAGLFAFVLLLLHGPSYVEERSG